MTIDGYVDRIVRKNPVFWQGPLCSEEHIQRFGDILPEVILKLWQRVGFSGFDNGATWLIDPLEWAEVGAELVRDVEVSFLAPDALLVPVARNSFGAVWFWSPGCGVCLEVNPATGVYYASRQQKASTSPEIVAYVWFSHLDSIRGEVTDRRGDGLFVSALDELGPVAVDECYAFVPSLLLGGVAAVANIQKVGLFEHLEILGMIRRGEFRLSVDAPDGSGTESFSPGPRPLRDVRAEGHYPYAAPVDKVALQGAVAEAIRGLVADDLPSWEVAVGTLVRDGEGGYASSIAAYDAVVSRNVRILNRPELRAPYSRAVKDMVLSLNPEWDGWKMTLFRDGRWSVVTTLDPVEASGWTSGMAGGVAREALADALRPEGF